MANDASCSGCRQVTLPGRPGDPEFDATYAVALAASEQNNPKKRGGEGTFDELIEIYLASPDLKEKKSTTQQAHRYILERFAEKYGQRHVKGISGENMQKLVDGIKNGWSKRMFFYTMRVLFRHRRSSLTEHMENIKQASLTRSIPVMGVFLAQKKPGQRTGQSR
jgi:hypothetical protein